MLRPFNIIRELGKGLKVCLGGAELEPLPSEIERLLRRLDDSPCKSPLRKNVPAS